MVTHPETDTTVAGTLSHFCEMFWSQIFVLHSTGIKSYTICDEEVAHGNTTVDFRISRLWSPAGSVILGSCQLEEVEPSWRVKVI